VCSPDDLRAIATALENGRVEGVSNPAKVAGEVRRYLKEARDGLRLEAALGLTPGPGKRAWWTKEAERYRNDQIREWACDLSGLSLRKKAQVIAKLGRDYQTRGFRLDQRRQAEPSSADPSRRRMRAILETGAPFPGVREIQRILKM
jgi:hypothetical protein